jgi:hypothetical protein
LDRSVSDAAEQGQANAQGVDELEPIFCGFVPTLVGRTVVGTSDGSSHKALSCYRLRGKLRQQHD